MSSGISITLAFALAALLLPGVAALATPGADDFRLAVWPQRAASPDFSLVDTNGSRRSVESYRGRVAVVYFGFLRCPDACPTGLAKLAAVRKSLGALAGQVQVLFVTLDPTRDTPAELKSYLRAFDLSFVGLTGSEAQVDRAAASFNVQYAKVKQGSDYTINHSAGIYVFDAAGRLRLVGTERSPSADFVHDLNAVLAGKAARN